MRPLRAGPARQGYPFCDPSHRPLADNATIPLLNQLWPKASQPLAAPEEEMASAYLFLLLELAARRYPRSAAVLSPNDASYFSRAFKKHVGVTPGALR